MDEHRLRTASQIDKNQDQPPVTVKAPVPEMFVIFPSNVMLCGTLELSAVCTVTAPFRDSSSLIAPRRLV